MAWPIGPCSLDEALVVQGEKELGDEYLWIELGVWVPRYWV